MKEKEKLHFTKLLAAFSKGLALGLHLNRVLCASFTPHFSLLGTKFLHNLVKFLT